MWEALSERRPTGVGAATRDPEDNASCKQQFRLESFPNGDETLFWSLNKGWGVAACVKPPHSKGFARKCPISSKRLPAACWQWQDAAATLWNLMDHLSQ